LKEAMLNGDLLSLKQYEGVATGLIGGALYAFEGVRGYLGDRR